ncbi:hypothetical protein C8Q78DRAFT_248516 [Trametes maxima]|nr:hypothetical protein C8Q78DRAFT_248516 [Trametes maxima]
MENCILPIETCEAIMDAIPSSPHYLTPLEYDALDACSLVCTTWRTRATVILVKGVELPSPQIASQFASTIRRESSGHMRAELLSLDWDHSEGDKNLSQAMELFMTPLPRLRRLSMRGVHIDISPRILKCIRPPLLTAITSLHFSRCKFYSWRDMLDIAWGCLKLEDLSLTSCSFGGNPATPGSIARLGVARRSLRGCQYLRKLHIDMMGATMGRLLPGEVIFGDTLTKLVLSDVKEEITPLFRNAFPRLESFHFWNLTGIEEVVYHGPCLLLAFATGPSPRPTLHSVVITLYFNTFTEESGGVSSYIPQWLEPIIGQAEEWDGHPLRSLFTGLRTLEIGLHKRNDRTDGEACTRHVLSVHPDVHDILQVFTDSRNYFIPP